jgi:uncharacterized protein (TIGR03435 family)
MTGRSRLANWCRVQPGAGAPKSSAAYNDLAPADPNGAISLYDAVRREPALKLEKVRRPNPLLVIDHINQQPTANQPKIQVDFRSEKIRLAQSMT